ncbi:hypothetical protein ABKN59_003888 [Abortiporus biennis]
MDSSEVGRYGTLRLMKRLEPDTAVASYPIDDEEVTMGRDQSCSIRLYYESVSALHCKIIFRDRKAFVVVLGTNGLLIDGCPVFPSTTPSSGPVTVPLPNHSTLEINKRRFQFCYPPKELRPILLQTPSASPSGVDDIKKRRRTLRMSMIQSAEVFTPRPSQDPRENLRILQTPLKTPFRAQRRQSSPLKRGITAASEDEDEEEHDEEIVLVETDHPKVVEEERDLVILEQVEVEEPTSEEPEPPRLVQYPIPQAAQPPPSLQRTPRRRAHPRASLHRAVLIRSAQRAVMRMEMEKEEEEVDEVEDTIIGGDEIMEDVEEEREEDLQQEYDEELHDEDEEEEGSEEQSRPPPSVFAWRKSLEAVAGGLTWPFRSTSPTKNEEHSHAQAEDEDEQDITDANDEEEGVVEHEHGPFQPIHNAESNQDDDDEDDEPILDPPIVPSQASLSSNSNVFHHHPPPLGNFMSPQVQRPSPSKRDHIRYSVGGFTAGGIRGLNSNNVSTATSGPRRVKMVEAWRVNDLVVPEPELQGTKKEEQHEAVLPPSPTKREKLSEEERKAIIERRRSALKTPDAFFKGQTPGSRKFNKFTSGSSIQPLPALALIDEAKNEESTTVPSTTASDIKKEDEDEDEDTQVMLAKMKQMVEGVKRRQSIGQHEARHRLSELGYGIIPSPKKRPGEFSLLAPGDDGADAPNSSQAQRSIEEQEEEGDIAEAPMDVDEDQNEVDDDQEEKDEEEEQPRSDGATTHEVASSTPRMDDLRHVFSQRRAIDQFATPRMDGMRDLFRQDRIPETPVFEGVGEMLATPAGYLHPEEETTETDPIPTETVPARQTKKPTSGSRTGLNATNTRRTTPRTVAQKPSPVTDLPSVPEDEPAPPVAEGSKRRAGTTASRVSRKPRSRTAEVETNEPEQPLAATVSRSTRSRSVTRDTPEVEPKPTSRDRTRSGSKEPTATMVMKPVSSSSLLGPTRRTRKGTVEPEEPPAPPTTTTKTTQRKLRAGSKTPQPEEPPVAPIKSSAVSKRGTRAKPIAVDEERNDDVKEEKDGASRVRRSTRSKTTAATPATIKEEEDDDSNSLSNNSSSDPSNPSFQSQPPTTSRGATTSRLRKPTSAPTRTIAATRATAATTTRGTGRKIPASEPAKQPGDKENTPERSGSPASGNDDDSEAVAAGPSRKPSSGTAGTKAPGARVVRGSSKVKEPPATEPPKRVSRSTKARK